MAGMREVTARLIRRQVVCCVDGGRGGLAGRPPPWDAGPVSTGSAKGFLTLMRAPARQTDGG